MAKKGWDDLVPDFKNALALGTKNVAHKVTIGLKERGPYWTGQFEGAWEVQTGQDGIAARLKDQSFINRNNALEYQGKEYREPGERKVTEPFVPEPDGLKGYMIGNLMEYREEAMDLDPDRSGPRYDADGDISTQATAREDWFVSYVKGGPMQKDVGKALDDVMRSEKFL